MSLLEIKLCRVFVQSFSPLNERKLENLRCWLPWLLDTPYCMKTYNNEMFISKYALEIFITRTKRGLFVCVKSLGFNCTTFRLFRWIDSMLPLVCSVITDDFKMWYQKSVAHKAQQSVWLMFLSYFDLFSDLLLNRPTVTWNLFFLYDKEAKSIDGDVTNGSVLLWVICKKQPNACILQLIIENFVVKF